MVFDKCVVFIDKMKMEEEKVVEEVNRLKKFEEDCLKCMCGEKVLDDE